MAVILMLGTFDTKEVEFKYLRERLMACGHVVLSANVGIMATSGQFPIEVGAAEIAQAAGVGLDALRRADNRDLAMEAMCNGAAIIVPQLYQAGRFHAVIGMGGGGGTAIVAAAMRGLPYGVPKVCVSTVASGDVSGYVGIKDIVMIPALTDLAGIHPISRMVIAQAAGAVCGMVEAELPLPSKGDALIIAATMFGNTTACVQACAWRLRKQGYQVLIFHATGTGGKMMESLIEEGYIDAVLDLTTTEIADEVCEGMMSAGPGRLSAAGRRGIPQVVAPGCLDMANFGLRESIPDSLIKEGRVFYSWNPNNTLMRTSIEENLLIGEQIALRLNASQGPVKVMLPLRGLSMLGEEGQPFYNPQADGALFSVMSNKLKPEIEIIEMDTPINEPAFAEKAVQVLLEMIRSQYEA